MRPGLRGLPFVVLLVLLLGLLGCGAPAAPDAARGSGDSGDSGGSGGSPGVSPGESSAGSSPAPPSGSDGSPGPSTGSEPISLQVASLGLDERLIELGIGPDGELEVPADPARVGWFSGGGGPGGSGPTVVVGHLDSTEGPAVVARVPDLEPGDRIEVGTRAGSVTYVVDEVADVPQQGFPTEQVFGSTPGDVLRLITCTGPYDSEAGRYTENRIVTALPAP